MDKRDVRGSWMFSWTTVDSIWLSGFGGMATSPVDSSSVQPSFSTYAFRSGPGNANSGSQHLY